MDKHNNRLIGTKRLNTSFLHGRASFFSFDWRAELLNAQRCFMFPQGSSHII